LVELYSPRGARAHVTSAPVPLDAPLIVDLDSRVVLGECRSPLRVSAANGNRAADAVAQILMHCRESHNGNAARESDMTIGVVLRQTQV
jgi:hypothetical protein